MSFVLCRARRAAVLLTIVTAVVTTIGPARSVAQRGAATPQQISDVILPDTGRMLRGDVDFSRYNHAGWCEEVTRSVVTAMWRGVEHDTLDYGRTLRDSLPSVAIAKTQQCAKGKSFDVATTPRHELGGLMRLSLITGDDETSRRVLDRQVAHATTDSMRASVLTNAIELFLSRRPARLALAADAVKRLDALGATVTLQRVAMHERLLTHYDKLGDTIHLRDEVEQILAIAGRVPAAERSMELSASMNNAYSVLWGIALARGGPSNPELDQLLVRAQSVLGPEVKVMYDVQRQFLGKPLRFPAIPFWFPYRGESGRGDSAQTQPRAGHPTFVIRLMQECGANCYWIYASLRRMAERYAPLGLDIVVLDKTNGYSTGTLTQTPEQEAESIRAYYQDYLKLPVTVAVEVTPYKVLPPPDGRRVDELTIMERRFSLTIPGGYQLPLGEFVLDKNGIIQMINSDREGAMAEILLRRITSE